jgi:hypothetical protein
MWFLALLFFWEPTAGVVCTVVQAIIWYLYTWFLTDKKYQTLERYIYLFSCADCKTERVLLMREIVAIWGLQSLIWGFVNMFLPYEFRGLNMYEWSCQMMFAEFFFCKFKGHSSYYISNKNYIRFRYTFCYLCTTQLSYFWLMTAINAAFLYSM